MRRNKAGLADLKALRSKTHAPEPPPPERPGRIARKRSPFLPPSERGSGDRPSSDDRTSGSRAAPAHAAAPRTALPVPATAARAAVDALLDEADRRLFRYAVRHVERMKDPGRVLLAPVAPAAAEILAERRHRAAGVSDIPAGRRPSPVAETHAAAPPSKRPLSDTYASAAHHHDDTRYLRPGHGTDVLKDLARGKWAIGASLDLHGDTLEEARERFDRFLTSCLTHDVKCVRIVHGKGYGSKDGDAVLKTMVRRWLTQIVEVIGYTECTEADGGAGAVQVLLK